MFRFLAGASYITMQDPVDDLPAYDMSPYGRLYLRHLNELDHEFQARLNKAYEPASKYMNSFTSPLATILAKYVLNSLDHRSQWDLAPGDTNVTFFAGALLSVLLGLSFYDQDVLKVSNVITVMAALGILIKACSTFIPDENFVWCPEALMKQVLTYTHYIPDHWKGRSHTSEVREQFSRLFQYKFAITRFTTPNTASDFNPVEKVMETLVCKGQGVEEIETKFGQGVEERDEIWARGRRRTTDVFLAEELISPLLTPLLLIFSLRYRSQSIVDFLRNFTVEVTGVGDVCSFAQLDVRKHGNPDWLYGEITQAQDYEQGENGKTELSLLHFSMKNPAWRPTESGERFISTIKEQAMKESLSMSGSIPYPSVNGEAINSINSDQQRQDFTTFIGPLHYPSLMVENDQPNSIMNNSMLYLHQMGMDRLWIDVEKIFLDKLRDRTRPETSTDRPGDVVVSGIYPSLRRPWPNYDEDEEEANSDSQQRPEDVSSSEV
eukprot:gene3583-4088_t